MDAVIVAKVEHAVQHEAERIYFAIDRECSGTSTTTTSKLRHAWCTSLKLIGSCRLVSDFGFQTETSKIITNDAVKIITYVMISFERIIGSGNIEFHIFGDHYTALDANIPLVITCQCRCG